MIKQVVSDVLIARSGIVAQILLAIVIGAFCGLVCDEPLMAFSCAYAILAFGHCVGMPLWDSQNNWENYRLAMPFSRSQIVRGRYVSALVFMVVGLLCGFASLLLVLGVAYSAGGVLGIEGAFAETSLLFGQGMMADFLSAVFVAGISITIMLLVCNSIQYPLAFKFGMEKAGRYIPIVAVLIIATIVAFGSFMNPEVIIVEIFAQDQVVIGLIALVVGFVIYGISLMLSMRFYSTREL